MNKKILLLLTITFLAGLAPLKAQPSLEKDYSFVMEVPSVITMESSPAHFYTLSETEGMVVFRARPDSLQWLYSSTGMERRGDTMTADIRFAYLYGDSRRLTILEPTSVLGVYSSTELPARPLEAKRIEQHLYVALGEQGLGQLSLESPSSVDSAVTFITPPEMEGKAILDLESSSDQLFALAADQQLYLFSYEDEELSLDREFDLSESLNRVYLLNNELYGSDEQGNIYEIAGSGNLSRLGSIEEEITQIAAWEDWLVIRGISNRLWTSYQNRRPQLWKEDEEAGNHFAVTKGNLWLSEYNQISRVISSEASTDITQQTSGGNGGASLGLQEINHVTIPHTQSLLLPLQLEQDLPADAVQFTYQSTDITDAKIRGQSFLWQPGSGNVGNHRVKIIATTTEGETDSTSFSIEVTSFNAPPRFAPIRPITIPVAEEFTLPISATDPDGLNEELIRFLGVDLPNGATINETTGEFTWTPDMRQVGENNFRVIATDQFGAASSVDITINVIEKNRRDASGR